MRCDFATHIDNLTWSIALMGFYEKYKPIPMVVTSWNELTQVRLNANLRFNHLTSNMARCTLYISRDLTKFRKPKDFLSVGFNPNYVDSKARRRPVSDFELCNDNLFKRIRKFKHNHPDGGVLTHYLFVDARHSGLHYYVTQNNEFISVIYISESSLDEYDINCDEVFKTFYTYAKQGEIDMFFEYLFEKIYPN